MADIKSLEHPTLKIPYELLNKKFRAAQKQLDREVSHVQSTTLEIERGLHGESARAGDISRLLGGAVTLEIERDLQGDSVRAGDISRLLGGMVERLHVLKRKAEESISEELEAAYVCKRRLEHLREHSGPNDALAAVATGAVNTWRRHRLDRMLVEYFLRCGYYGAATQLANRSDLRDLTNIDVFMVSREVERSLAARETTKCLAWCHDNRSKLRKLKSSMEFNLRVQEFVEYVRIDRRMEAVKHARKYFSCFEDEQLQDIQHCMALLAFPTDTELEPYKELFDERRWGKLVEQFRQENYRIFQQASQSVFTVALQAGLSALKTPQCYSSHDNHNPSCPVCHENLNALAAPLPFAHCTQSRLICTISGLPLNEPMMLPNGHVYGEQALEHMALEHNGLIVCPKTKEIYPYKKLEKVYVM